MLKSTGLWLSTRAIGVFLIYFERRRSDGGTLMDSHNEKKIYLNLIEYEYT